MLFVKFELSFIGLYKNKFRNQKKKFPTWDKSVLFNKSFQVDCKQLSNRSRIFLGPGGGFLGVGTSELIVIGIVAWLILGPKRLYQLAKDVGKISAEIKNVTEQAKITFNQSVKIEPESLAPLSSKFEKNQNIQKKENSADFDKKIENEISSLFE